MMLVGMFALLATASAPGFATTPSKLWLETTFAEGIDACVGIVETPETARQKLGSLKWQDTSSAKGANAAYRESLNGTYQKAKNTIIFMSAASNSGKSLKLNMNTCQFIFAASSHGQDIPEFMMSRYGSRNMPSAPTAEVRDERLYKVRSQAVMIGELKNEPDMFRALVIPFPTRK